MPGGTPFLVVEFPGEGLAFAQLTQRNPGCSVDMLSDPVETEGQEKWHSSVFLVRNAPPAEIEKLVADLTRMYERPRILRSDAAAGVWMGRCRTKESAMPSRGAKAILAFQESFGVPWCHIEDGVLYMRARVHPRADAEALVARICREFADRGLEAQVEVQDISPADFGVWTDLVQASLGWVT